VLRLIQKISLPHFRGNWGRSALVIGGTATGVALIVAIDIINVSVLANFRHSIETIAGPAALEVTLGTGEIGYPEHWVDTVREVEGVVAARPLVRGTIAFADRPEETVALFGIDLVENDDLASYQIALETDRRAVVSALLEDPLKTILVTKRFADEEGLRVGDPLTVTTPSGVTTLTIRGLLAAEGIGRAFGGRIAVMDLPAAQQFLGKDRRIDQIDIVVREGVAVDVVRDAVQKRLPETLTVDRPARRGVLYERIIASFQALLSGLSLLCLVAGVYIIYNTTSTGAVHRAAVIAGLRLIGADPHRLFRLLMLEALVLGVVGTGLGIPIGIALANLLTGLVSETMGVVFQLRLPLESLTIDLRDQAVIGAAGVAATLFASYFAARRVTRLPPLDVFRADLRSLAVRTPTARLLAWWLVLVAISGAALYLEVRYKSANWGNFASTLWFASSIVIAVPLVTLLAPLLERGLSRFFGAEGLMAAESLSRSPTRTGVTVAAIALVLTVGIMISSLALSHRESVRGQVLGGMLSCDLAVSAVATEGGWLETPIPRMLAESISNLDGIESVETVRALPGHLYAGRRVAVVGVSDGLVSPERFPPGWYRDGDPIAAAAAIREGRGTLISEAFADRFDFQVGQTVYVDTPTGVLDLTVVGVVRDYISDRGSLWFSQRLLRTRWQDDAVSWMLVFAKKGASITALRAQIAAGLSKHYRLKILTLDELDRYLGDKIDGAYAFTSAIQLLVAIVTVAGIFDLLLAAVWERRRELAVWRVIGANKQSVQRSVILESGAIGALGSILGIAVGIVTTLIWIHAHYRHLLGYYLELHISPGTTLWYVALIVSMTILAGYGAARHATRETILEGIQSE
jgi:putative ABC transport system permease protein